MLPENPTSATLPPLARDVQVVPVSGRRAQRRFVHLVWSLYAGDPAWVPPLVREEYRRLSRRNPYFDHADCQTWIALREGRAVGRISAQIDRLYLQRYADGTGFFGQLEGENDPALFAALFATAEGWLRLRGMRRACGPFDLSINEQCGLLVEGFDRPPAVMMGHAPPFYGPRVEEQGYTGVRDLLAYRIRSDFSVPARLEAMVRRFDRRIKLRPLDPRRFEQDLALLQEIFEDAWSGNWGFIPFTAEEFRHLGKNLKALVDPDFVRFAEVDAAPAAMMVVFPNLNEAIRDLDGRLAPLGWLKLLWRLKVARLKTGRVPLMGVRRRFQGTPLGAALALRMIVSLRESVRRRGMEETELSWILEENKGMRTLIEAIGGTVAKRYRIYEKDLS